MKWLLSGGTDLGSDLGFIVIDILWLRGVALDQHWSLLNADFFAIIAIILVIFLVGYVEERLWWPIQIPNKGRKKNANS